MLPDGVEKLGGGKLPYYAITRPSIRPVAGSRSSGTLLQKARHLILSDRPMVHPELWKRSRGLGRAITMKLAQEGVQSVCFRTISTDHELWGSCLPEFQAVMCGYYAFAWERQGRQKRTLSLWQR
jgi:hypothetical protein